MMRCVDVLDQQFPLLQLYHDTVIYCTIQSGVSIFFSKKHYIPFSLTAQECDCQPLYQVTIHNISI